MNIRPLRQILSFQATIVAVLPFTVLVALVAAWLYPRILADFENRQVQLATTIVTQIESRLEGAVTIVKSIAALQMDNHFSPELLQHVIEKHLHPLGTLKALYIVGPEGRVTSVALTEQNEAQRQDLLGIDMTYNHLYLKVHQLQLAYWSDTFLSVVGGRLSVAFGMPAGNRVIIGEVDLGSLTQHLNRISLIKDQSIFVIDGHGQVIADQDGRYTAQQLNLGNIDLVARGLKSLEPCFGTFDFSEQQVVGSMAPASMLDWHVLVVSPEKAALREMRTTISVFILILLATSLAGISAALFASHRIAQRFETLAVHARSIANNGGERTWPAFTISEFHQLTVDLKLMADSIRQREAYNRVLFSDSPIPLVVADTETRKFMDANVAAVKHLDLEDRSELVGKSLPDFSAKEQAEGKDAETALQRHYTACFEKGNAFFDWRFQNPTGRIWYGDVAMSLFSYGTRRYVQFCMVDTTKRRQAEEEKEAYRAQFQQAQKLESVGRLAGGVAHDLNNLLSPILGYSEMLLDDGSSEDKAGLYAEQIQQAGIRARDIVRQLLAFSRKQTMELEILNLADVLEGFDSLLRRTIREDITIKTIYPPGLPMVKGDIGQLEQVIMNLAVNAQDAMPGGGVLTMEISVVELDGKYASIGEDVVAGDYVVLAVSDTGEGIDPETRKLIFEPFFTTKGKDQGTGLGLSTVYGIVKQHGGHVWVYSELGMGTTFKICLPVTYEQDAPARTAEKQIVDLHGDETILLVEDDEPVKQMAVEILEHYGYHVRTAGNGEEALEVVAADNGKPHLLLTDVVMPGMNGKELYGKMSRRYPGIKAIYMSGYTENVIAHSGIMDAGVNFIQKPFSVRALLVKVRQVLDS